MRIATVESPSEIGSYPRCTIREAALRDYESVAALQRKYGMSVKSYDDWAHLWVNNRVYASLADRWPIGWVLENPSSQTVGFIGNIPLEYYLHGKRLTASAGCSWVVDEEYRGYAAWLMDNYFRHPAALYLNTTVAQTAAPTFTQFGSLRVPVGAWDARAFAITNYRGFVQSVLRLYRIPVAGFLGALLAPLLFLSDKLKSKPVPSAPRADLSVVDGFDQRFDFFWEQMKDKFPTILLGDRSADALNWHFGPALARGDVWTITQDAGGGIRAYAIFVRRDRPEIGLTRMRLADFQSLDGNNTLLIPMLEWAISRCRRDGVHVLEMVGYERENEQLLHLLPHRQTLPAWQYYYLAKNRALATALADVQAWRPYPYDGDAIL